MLGRGAGGGGLGIVYRATDTHLERTVAIKAMFANPDNPDADEPAHSPQPTESNLFPDTHWSTVRKLRGDDPKAAQIALDSLCAAYWQPICQYIRYRGQSAEDAEDLTQEFIHQLMVRPKKVFGLTFSKSSFHVHPL